jgi:flavin reductase (DIM6/NTAB) family NADH-FMN oxidoreductase RutF
MPHRLGSYDLPLLEDALVWLECELEAVHPFGAQQILVGRVAEATVHEDRAPLLFVDRHFAQPGGRP